MLSSCFLAASRFGGVWSGSSWDCGLLSFGSGEEGEVSFWFVGLLLKTVGWKTEEVFGVGS